MQAEISWQGDVRFDARSGSGHTIALDGPPESGGQNAGARPMELVLMGVGACSAYDVVHILGRMREDVVDVVARLDADRAPEPPQVFTAVRMHFIVTGRSLKPKNVERAVKLSAEQYCSASIMLARGGVRIEHTFEIIEAE